MRPISRLRVAAVLLLLTCNTGCAVFMAAKGKKDPDVGGLVVGQDRVVVHALLGSPAKTYGTNGERIDVFQWKRGDEPSPWRAIVHGALDLSTVFLWEIVGTSIEASQGEVVYLSIEYDSQDRIARMVPGDDGRAMAALQQSAAKQPTNLSSAPSRPPVDTEAIAKSVIGESRQEMKKHPLRSLFQSPSTDYAMSARTIASDPGLAAVDKLHSLATLSAIHAAKATDPEEKSTYTRLNEQFLKRAQSLEDGAAHEQISSQEQKPSAPGPVQASYLEESANQAVSR